MKRKKQSNRYEAKHYPNDKETQAREEALDIFNPASSVTDCTGLIPFGVQDESQLEAYREIISFTAPDKDNLTEE